MVNRPKNIGTAAETAVVRVAHTRGFPGADRLTQRGRHDRGDIGLAPGVILEVKAGHAAETASDAQIDAWLHETETERANAAADVAILVTKRKGHGPTNAHRWWAHMRARDLLTLAGHHQATTAPAFDQAPVRLTLELVLLQLRAAGYGDPLPEGGAA